MAIQASSPYKGVGGGCELHRVRPEKAFSSQLPVSSLHTSLLLPYEDPHPTLVLPSQGNGRNGG